MEITYRETCLMRPGAGGVPGRRCIGLLRTKVNIYSIKVTISIEDSIKGYLEI